MSNLRSLHLDSAFRDRTKNPLASDFEVELGGDDGILTARDPISDAAPLLLFTGNFDASGGATLVGAIEAVVGVGATNEVREVVITVPAGELQQAENWYNGAVLRNTTIASNKRIVSFRYLNTVGGFDRAIITVEPPFESTLAAGNVINIINPSDNGGPTPFIFIPEGILLSDNFYIGELLEDTTIGETRTIIFYDSSTGLAQLDSPYGGGWTNTDSYVLRKKAAFATGTLVASTINTFTLPVAFTNEFNFFTGNFIRITSGPAINDIRRINAYSNATVPSRVGRVLNFSAVPGAANFELLQFTRDNYTRINYTGSVVSQQEMVCYEICLLSLTLPNATLSVGNGSRITFYPEVSVELSSVTAPQTGIVYSNNPFYKKTTFVVPLQDNPTPLISAFIVLNGAGMVQTIKFKPNDTLSFKVRLSNGELFQTVLPETTSPNAPNPLAQISALFSIKRL